MKTLNMDEYQARLLRELVRDARQRHDRYWESQYKLLTPNARQFLREEFGHLNALLHALDKIIEMDSMERKT